MRRYHRKPDVPPGPTPEEQERWVSTMPVLAAIVRSGEPRCVLHGTERGQVHRETEWGTLYLCGDHYTLCSKPEGTGGEAAHKPDDAGGRGTDG